jgi:hypothetical protein
MPLSYHSAARVQQTFFANELIPRQSEMCISPLAAAFIEIPDFSGRSSQMNHEQDYIDFCTAPAP